MKTKYKGVFNLNHEIFILYAYAYSERQAWLNMCRRISKQHEVPLSYVTGEFDGRKDNYGISKEKEA